LTSNIAGVIDQMEFGRTGHLSSRVIFGAAALGTMRQDRADALLDSLLEFGVNHIDTAAGYGDSELRIAPWMAEHRDKFFLATKTGDRSGPAARASLERSLERLGVDQVDLIQLHNLVEDDEWAEAHAPGGAVEALVQARAEGLTRFVGVTGHGLRIAGMHLRSLERFDFDSVLLPYNFALWQNPAYRGDAERLFEVCRERNVAVQTIKSVARRRWREGNSDPSPHFTGSWPIRGCSSTAPATAGCYDASWRPPARRPGRPRPMPTCSPTSSAWASSPCSTVTLSSASKLVTRGALHLGDVAAPR
jgi:aryl-alcohol dehydrogenase-like predicted oxidoreductase